MSAPPAVDRRRARALAPAAFFCGSALAAGALMLLDAAPALRAAAALPVFLGGAAYPLLVASAPDEASPAKVGLLAWLLSPCWMAAVFALARLALPAQESAAAALFVAALLQPLALRRVLRVERLGGAGRSALGLGAALGALVVALHAAVPALRHMGDGMWHAGLIAAVDRSLAPTNPWLAEMPIAHPLAYHVLGDLVERLFHVAPTSATVWLSAWAAAALPPALYFVAAPLWSEARRALVALLAALFAWNACGGWLWLARGLELRAASDASEWLDRLASASPDGAPGLPLFGGAELVLPGPLPVALALAASAWFAAAHALRHARAPWIWLCPLLHGLALLADPGVGLAAAGATAAAAIVAPGVALARPALLLGLVVACAPGVLASRGSGVGPVLGELKRWDGRAALFAALLPAAACALRALVAVPSLAQIAGRRSLVALIAAGALVPLGIGLCVHPTGALPSGALRLVGFALGIGCAGALVGAWDRGGAPRVAAASLGVACSVGGALVHALVLRDVLSLRDVDAAVVEEPLGLAPLPRELPPELRIRDRAASAATSAAPFAIDADTVAAYAWLRRELPADWRRAVLLLDESREIERLPHAPRPHPAPLFAGLDLWADRSEPSAQRHPRLATRVRAARELFERSPYAGPALQLELEQLGRAALLFTGSGGRPGGAALESELTRLGFELLHESGAVRVWGWSPAGRR